MHTRSVISSPSHPVARLIAACTIALGAVAAQAQSCHTAALRNDPTGIAGTTVARIGGDFRLRQTSTRTVPLKAGQSVWVSGSGCPRTDEISLIVTDPSGQVVLERIGHVTGGCIKAGVTGNYRLTVMPVSLNSGYDWGSIAAEASQSRCEQGG